MKLNLFVLIALISFVFGCGHQTPTTNEHSKPADHSAHHDSHTKHGSVHSSDPDAERAPYDLQFIDTMIHHHEGALEMAEVVLKKSTNEELRKFAEKIIEDQKKEIEQMKSWREAWYANKPRAINMEMPGMKDSMKMMTDGRMEQMEKRSGKEFDLMFLDLMIEHHEGAVTMSQEALQKAERQEIKTLAEQIIKAQQQEIKQMQEWKEKWK
ncbi:MAG: hypothetical protein KatS3mg006_0732 [Pyrinomonadaceae bacterium]|nr:MAG: hypothetical protein KatS3mg006_0732 [Pyrinomonadaceae bacterium]